MARSHRQSGFSLLEIMVALSILAMSLTVILNLHGSTMLKSQRAERITTASMLARLRLHEIQLELEKEIDKGVFPDDNKTMEGTFDEPYEDFKWKAEIKKVEIPVPADAGGEEGERGEAASMAAMFTAFKMVAEKIGEATREIKVVIFWGETEEDRQEVSVATHIVKL